VDHAAAISAGENLTVRIRPVSTNDLISMDANPVAVVTPDPDSDDPRHLASRAYTRTADPDALARKELTFAQKIADSAPEPPSVSLHSDSITMDGGAASGFTRGRGNSVEFAGIAIGNEQFCVTPGVCRTGDEIAPYAGIGVSF
jgi:hypothetical protein